MRVHLAAEVEPALIGRLAGDPRFVLVDALEEAEIVITRTTNEVSARLMDLAPRLRLIAQGTSGIDNIDVDAARTRGISVIHLPGVNANAVAEQVIGTVIALTRTLPLYHREVASGVWDRSRCASRHEIRHYRLGIVGLGNVGTRVARLASGFGMHAKAWDPFVSDFGEVARAASLDELLASCDVVTLHVPLTPHTRGMIGEAEIGLMPAGAFLVNTSRGEVLRSEAALAALLAGRLGGLALDVYDPEPPRRVWPDHPALMLTPHVAGCTAEAKNAASNALYQRIVEFVEGDGGTS